MDTFDFVIIGAGPAGEAAVNLACRRGASVAVVERDLFGGACPFWACMPSKTLLHGAAVHAGGGDYPWPRLSDRRDYMIVREGIPYPDDSGHEKALRDAGAETIRGTARFVGPGRVEVALRDGGRRVLGARDVIVATGSTERMPDIEGLAASEPWRTRDATATRTLPESLVVLGGGPSGVELTQVFARYGVRTTLVDSHDRILSRDHPRSSAALDASLRAEGVDIRLHARTERVQPAADGGEHVLTLSDGSTARGERILVSLGRELELGSLGLETAGINPDANGRYRADASLRLAEHVFVAGDPAGSEQFTHVADYEGQLAVRVALGDDVRPDLRAVPRATYTDPETGSVGLSLAQATERGFDALETTADLATSAKGYVSEAAGHVSIVVDRASRKLLGAFIAGPGAGEAIHEAVLAIKLGVTIDVLADTIHAFPTTARVMGNLFGSTAADL